MVFIGWGWFPDRSWSWSVITAVKYPNGLKHCLSFCIWEHTILGFSELNGWKWGNFFPTSTEAFNRCFDFFLILVRLPLFYPKINPCEWGSAYWRAAGDFFFSSLTFEESCVWNGSGSRKEATDAVLVLQSGNKMMASTSFRFAVLLLQENRAQVYLKL